LLTEKDEKFVEFWALRYSNYFGYFKGDFHLKIYLNVGNQRTRMGWEAPPTTNFRLQLHTAVTSCPGWPGTGSPATNAGVDK
jgi:hypothetical protein